MAINAKLRLTLLFFAANLGLSNASNSFFIQSLDSLNVKSSDRASILLAQKKYDSLFILCKNEIAKLVEAPIEDSLEIARLYKYQNKAHYQLNNYLEAIKSAEFGLIYCNNSEEGRLLKGKLYSDKASAESYSGKDRRTFNSTLNAIKYLTSVDNPDYDYLITSYRFVAEQCAYHGNITDAKMYLRQAENLYNENKEAIDQLVTDADGFRHKYEIILAYSKVYQLYQYGKSKSDSLELMATLKNLESYHKAPDFDIKRDGIYYTTALNHIGDWYASRKPEKETTKEDLVAAFNYINKSIDLIENENYSGTLLSLKYNRVKVLALSNQLEIAEKEINQLLNSLSESDPRRAFFLAQKGLIKAKQKQKDNTVATFFNAIQKVHSDSVALKDDFSNFKPSTKFGHTKLVLRIAEELNRYFPEDSLVNKIVAKLYPIAFNQFENSYDKRKFNKTQKTYLRQILKGILNNSKQGYIEDENPMDILNRFENIQNQLAWQKFNQNRQLSNFPQLDSLQVRNYELRELIANFKYKKNTSQSDSLQTLLSQTEKYTKETFPNLSLFNTASIKVEDLKNQLADDALVIKYVVFENQIAIYSITNKSLDFSLKPWSTFESELTNLFIEQVRNKNFNNQKAIELAKLILPKIDTNIEHVIINPDAQLSELPFEVLVRDKKLLIETYDISYTSSLGFIFPSVIQGEHNNALAIYAPEYPQSNEAFVVRSKPVFLEGAKQESELISGLFSSHLYSGKELTKRDFIQTASGHKLLHLAMHAVIDNSQSGISRLLFSNENSESDDLYLEEIYGLNLSADLAVLSACNTGVDKSNSGSDIESFQRAFTFAGVPATVASLWEVPDQPTKEIMVNFYKNLKNGEAKSEALKYAKLKFKEDHQGTKLAEPYYWAGFVLYGQDTPVSSSVSNELLYWIIIGLAFIFIGSIFYNLRKKRLNQGLSS
ncbi:CHAT domain-containing protein [Winogradskyella sp.]|uniref:CHAT domain-containing protein n=1 Tax=Winogradskyella sp. TaxID=1883156 RepID=UPI00262C2E8E|nr:CHAT domain-containing protein [Winogradskyella sp.]